MSAILLMPGKKGWVGRRLKVCARLVGRMGGVGANQPSWADGEEKENASYPEIQELPIQQW